MVIMETMRAERADSPHLVSAGESDDGHPRLVVGDGEVREELFDELDFVEEVLCAHRG